MGLNLRDREIIMIMTLKMKKIIQDQGKEEGKIGMKKKKITQKRKRRINS